MKTQAKMLVAVVLVGGDGGDGGGEGAGADNGDAVVDNIMLQGLEMDLKK